jgi:hypothetical protein
VLGEGAPGLVQGSAIPGLRANFYDGFTFVSFVTTWQPHFELIHFHRTRSKSRRGEKLPSHVLPSGKNVLAELQSLSSSVHIIQDRTTCPFLAAGESKNSGSWHFSGRGALLTRERV